MSGNLLAEDGEATGASFPTGVQQCRRDEETGPDRFAIEEKVL